jgi:glutamine amidotransferase
MSAANISTVSIIDCGVGNVGSVANMIAKAGGGAQIIQDPGRLAEASRVILCGVGAFDRGMSRLTAGGWIDPLREAVIGRGVPLLGICLGMQLLCRDSEEGKEPGLGLIPASVRRLTPGDARLRIPHVGWSDVTVRNENPLFRPEDAPRYYFTHSYHAVCDRPEDVLGTVEYGGPVTAAIGRGNIRGVQFHPEKSHRHGLRLLANFLRS